MIDLALYWCVSEVHDPLTEAQEPTLSVKIFAQHRLCDAQRYATWRNKSPIVCSVSLRPVNCNSRSFSLSRNRLSPPRVGQSGLPRREPPLQAYCQRESSKRYALRRLAFLDLFMLFKACRMHMAKSPNGSEVHTFGPWVAGVSQIIIQIVACLRRGLVCASASTPYPDVTVSQCVLASTHSCQASHADISVRSGRRDQRPPLTGNEHF